MRNDVKPVYRFPLLIMGMLALLVGTLAGLSRLGIMVPQMAIQQAAIHGVLMVPAFFGTVIGLERAVALGQRWAYAAPLLTGIGGLVLLTGMSPVTGFAVIAAGSLVFVAVSVQVVRIQTHVHNWILLGGALGLLGGNLLLVAGYAVPELMYWWMAFLLLTIAGERLELSRLVISDDRKRRGLAVLSLLPLAGAMIGLFDRSGIVIFALGLAAIGLWLLLFDIARRTVRLEGLTRFTAVCMLAGYVWLLVSALFFMAMQFVWLDLARDAALHSFFLGFVFSMVFGHALIIFPAVTRLNIPYSAIFYLPLLLLQVSLALRVAGGLFNNGELLAFGGLMNGITLGVFILTLVWHMVSGQLQRREKNSQPMSNI